MAGKHATVLPEPRSEQVHRPPRSRVIMPGLVAAEGAALVVLAGLDGSPVWRVVRVLVVIAATAVGAWATHRARAGRGAAALVAGIVGTVTGAGVDSAHLAKAGLDAAAIVAAIVLVTGIVLLVWGAATLIRAVPGWWRLLAVPAAIALLWFVLYPLTVAVYATNLPPGPLGSATPASYGLTYRDVAFRTADGVRLSGWYIPPHNGAAVVVLPGSGSTRTAVLSQAAVLARHGYGTLLLDTRGHGLSGGHAMDFGWWGDRDIAAAVSFLARQPARPRRQDRCGGGVHGRGAGSRRYRRRLADPRRRRRRRNRPAARRPRLAAARDRRCPPAWHGMGAVHRGRADQRRPTPNEHPRCHPGRCPPAGADHRRRRPSADEPIAARWFQAASPATVHVWVVPHAGHTQGLATAPRAWEAHVISFLHAALASAP